MRILFVLAILSAFAVNANADIVYTTSNTSGGQSNSNVPSQPTSQNQGFVIGQFITSTNFSFYANKAVVRFTTGTSSNLNFTGIRWNAFLDDHAGSTASGITSGSFLWTLYNNQNGSVSTFTQSLNSIVHDGSNFSPNVYQNGTWTLTGGSSVLDASTTYTLALTGLTIGTTTGILNQDELHWSYYTSAAAGGQYNIVGTGTMATPSGTGAITSLTPDAPGIGLAYDLNAVAVPEPGSFLLGTVIALLSGIGVCFKRFLI